MPSLIVDVSLSNVSVTETYANVIVNLDDGSNVNVAISNPSVNVALNTSNIVLSTTTESYVGGTGVTIVGGTISIGQNVATNSLVQFAGLNLSGGNVTNANVINATTINATTINANIVGNITGNINGNLTGNVTGNLTGNVTGNVTGNITGNLTGNVTGNVSGSAGTAGTATTANVATRVSLANATGNLTQRYLPFSSANVATGNIALETYSALYYTPGTGTLFLNYIDGNGSKLSDINGANVSGFVGNAAFANTAGYVDSLTINDGSTLSGNSYLVTTQTTPGSNGAVYIDTFSYAPKYSHDLNSLFVGANIRANGSNGYVSATGFIGDGAGLTNITSTANAVSPTATNTTNATHYLLFSNAATGGSLVRTDTSLQYNPSTNTLTASTFSGSATQLGGFNANTYARLLDATFNGNVVANNFETAGNLNVYGTVVLGSATSNSVVRMGGTGTPANVLVYGALTVDATSAGGGTGLIKARGITIAATQPSPNVCLDVDFRNAATTYLGAVGNIKITGGSSGNVLTTDGTGNLSWGSVDAYGNSNVAAFLPTFTGNLAGGNITVTGNANAAIFNGTTGNIATVNATTLNGNIDFGTF